MYRVRTYDEATDQIASLPREALPYYAQVLGVLEVAPWNGMPYVKSRPDGTYDNWCSASGNGLVTYLILEDQRYVDVLEVLWIG